MLEQLPAIFNYVGDMVQDYWTVITGCSVLAGFVALGIIDRVFHIFDILRR